MRILQSAVWLVTLSLVISAQNAVLSGSVTDEHGAIIPDTKIEVSGENGKQYQVSTNYEGVYRIEIPCGLYKISVSRLPFTKLVLSDYWIPPHGSMRLDVALRCVGCQIIEHPVAEPDLIEIEETKIDVSIKVLKRPVEKSIKRQFKSNKENREK